MKKAYRESLKKVFVSLFIFFYTFLPNGIAIADIVNELKEVISPTTLHAAEQYSILSTSGIWTSATPSGAGVTGLNNNTIRWGTGNQRSGLKFDGTGVQNFDADTNDGRFLIGELTHMNWPISGTAANSATLKVTLNFSNPAITPSPTFTFDFDINETTNTTWLSQCVGYGTDEQISNTPCDDVITFLSPYSQDVFTIGDTEYTLKIDGFQSDYPEGDPVSKFVTEERKDNTAYLIGHLSSILIEEPQIKITKKVNDEDANEAPGVYVDKGSTVEFKYIVQNSGNVKLSGISVTDDQGVEVTCPQTELDPGATMTCTGSDIAVTGQYTNIGTVTASSHNLTARDPANYFGVETVKICHRTDSNENPYEIVNPGMREDLDGHINHTGEIWKPGMDAGTWGDIIPPFTFGDGREFSGYNWSDYGQAIYDADCTIPKGSLTVKKIVTPNDDTTQFTITGTGSSITGAPTFLNDNIGSISKDISHTYSVYPGIYSVEETVSDDWKEVSNTCSNITIENGESKECTITNTKFATLTVLKATLPTDSNQIFNFTSNITGSEIFTLKDKESKVFTLEAGTYSVSESDISGWQNTDITCTDGSSVSEINLSAGEDVTCTFTNTKYGKISGYKLDDKDGLVNTTDDRTGVSGWTIFIDMDNDGKLSEGDPSTTTNGGGYYEFTDLLPGTYKVYEALQVGWIVLVGDNFSITLSAGEDKTDVTFINVKQGSITVKKNVDGNGDGDLDDDVDIIGATDWTWTLDDVGYPTGSKVSSLNPGEYTIKEVNKDNYHFESLECTGGSAVEIVGDTATINLKSGEDVVCTYTNARNLGKLVIVKEVINDNGGTKKATDFSFKIGSEDAISFTQDGENELKGKNEFTKYAGLSYSITEVEADQDGYTTTYHNCFNVVVPHDEVAICTITNDDIAPTLKIVKEVINDNGGNATIDDFGIKLNTNALTFGGGVVSGSTTTYTSTPSVLSNTEYTLSEIDHPGYTEGTWSCVDNSTQATVSHPFTLSEGQGITCTITNDDIAPKLTLIKEITKNYGGTAQPDDFSLTVGGTAVTSGTAKEYTANTPYTINETALVGYEFVSITGDDKCPTELGGTITLDAGDNVTCTITNKDLPAQLTVIKKVINEGNDGTKSASDFTINVEGTNVSNESFLGSEDGITITLSQGAFKVTEDEDTENYTATYEDCEGTISVGEEKTCIITNTGIDHMPIIEVTKKADKTSVKETGEDVEFTFTVKNTSKVDTVTITSLLDTVFGNLDGDHSCKIGTELVPDAECNFTITKHISGNYSGDSHSNVFTAIAKDEEDNEATNSDDETITFTDVLPDITVTKTAGVTEIPETGGDVTFTFTVTNNSLEPGEIVSLSDSEFGSLTGDTNCQVGTVLAGETSCSFTATFNIPANTPGDPDAPTSHTNVFTATVKDDEDNTDTDEDDEIVTLTPVPSLKLVKNVIHKYNSNEDITAANWTLYANGDGGFNYAGNTNEFKFVKAGVTYSLSEYGTYSDQFEASDWVCDDGTLTGNQIVLTAEDDVVCTITNEAKPATVVVYKDVIDGEEDIYSDQDFEVTLQGILSPSQYINDSKTEPKVAIFSNLDRGSYTPEEINIPNGYISNGCFPIERPEVYSLTTLMVDNSVYVNNGETLSFICTNEVIEPLLEITKENDTGGAGMYPGDTVTYTITITTPSDEKEGTYALKDIIVTDLLPEGFTYIPGSWTGTPTEPVYSNNLAKWYIGDMQEGDTVVLTYKALISPTQEPGIYPDIAWTKGTSLSDNEVLGNVSTGALSPFVGTEVLVIGEYDIEEGEVLGISTTTTLPSTGASKYITIGALISMLLGLLSLIFQPSTSKRKSFLIVSILTIGIFTLVKPNIAYAEGGLSTDIDVRIEQPETKTNKNTFNIGYVVLDTEEREIKVKCIEETYGTFDTHSTNSGSCKVDSSVVTGNGTYKFYVEVSTVSGAVELEKSKTVTVNVDLSKPQAVKEYSKTEGACSYTLSFKSSTPKVQIFRSDNQVSFFANASTLITKPHLTVIPNSTSTYIDNDLSDCTKTYYYAIRSIDDYNNVSTLITDDIVTTVTAISPTTTTTSTPTTLTAITTDSGEVEGETIVDKDSAVEKEEEVKGEEDKKEEEGKEEQEEEKTFIKKYWPLLAILLIVIGGVGYDYVKRKK